MTEFKERTLRSLSAFVTKRFFNPLSQLQTDKNPMRAINPEEMQFQNCPSLTAKLLPANTKHWRIGMILFAVSSTLMIVPIILIVAASLLKIQVSPPIHQFLGDVAFKGFILMPAYALWFSIIRRVRCPRCGKKLKLRRKHTGNFGDEEVIAVCLDCRIQAPTGVEYGG